MPDQISYSARFLDLSSRFAQTSTVSASPTAAVETVVATVAIPANLTVVSGILLFGWLAFTVGTTGATAQLRIRQTNVSGAVVANSGATTAGIAAAALATLDAQGFDSGLGVLAYVLTLQVGSATAGSTVSAANLAAIVI